MNQLKIINLMIFVLVLMVTFYLKSSMSVPLLEARAKNNQYIEEIPLHKLGTHIIAELCGCNCERLNAFQELESVLYYAGVASGATVLKVESHVFEPSGMSGIAILQESHISVHTWPEYGYASIDIFTCGEHVNPERALQVLCNFFMPDKMDMISIDRGFLH